MRTIVFDLDETLFATRVAVINSYVAAGVNPRQARLGVDSGEPWHNWCSPQQHHKKVAFYAERIARGMINPLPPLLLMLEVRSDVRTLVCTTASFDTSAMLLARYGLVDNLAVAGISPCDKAVWLKSVNGEVVYVDDRYQASKQIAKDADVPVVWYNRQQLGQLRQEIEDKWTA